MYGYGAVAVLHPVALKLTEAHYGRAPDYVYGDGRSMGAGSRAPVFTTPVEGDPESLQKYLMEFDFEEGAPKIDAATDAFPRAMELMTPPGSDEPDDHPGCDT